MSLEEDIESRHAGQARAVPSEAAPHPPSRELAHGALGRLSRDELVHQDICAALLASRDFDAHAVEVEMSGEGLTLRGTVASERDRRRAVEIATSIAGRRLVRDALTVTQSDHAAPQAFGSAHGQCHGQ
jgi:osmotically-inducible protein OsmY